MWDPSCCYVKGPLLEALNPTVMGTFSSSKALTPSKHIICMDPAFQKDSETTICYDLQDFIPSQRRLFIAYVFNPPSDLHPHDIFLCNNPILKSLFLLSHLNYERDFYFLFRFYSL